MIFLEFYQIQLSGNNKIQIFFKKNSPYFFVATTIVLQQFTHLYHVETTVNEKKIYV